MNSRYYVLLPSHGPDYALHESWITISGANVQRGFNSKPQALTSNIQTIADFPREVIAVVLKQAPLRSLKEWSFCGSFISRYCREALVSSMHIYDSHSTMHFQRFFQFLADENNKSLLPHVHSVVLQGKGSSMATGPVSVLDMASLSAALARCQSLFHLELRDIHIVASTSVPALLFPRLHSVQFLNIHSSSESDNCFMLFQLPNKWTNVKIDGCSWGSEEISTDSTRSASVRRLSIAFSDDHASQHGSDRQLPTFSDVTRLHLAGLSPDNASFNILLENQDSLECLDISIHKSQEVGDPEKWPLDIFDNLEHLESITFRMSLDYGSDVGGQGRPPERNDRSYFLLCFIKALPWSIEHLTLHLFVNTASIDDSQPMDLSLVHWRRFAEALREKPHLHTAIITVHSSTSDSCPQWPANILENLLCSLAGYSMGFKQYPGRTESSHLWSELYIKRDISLR